jgi:hypothetical protein
LWVAGEYQARANIALSEAAAALRNALAGIGLQPTLLGLSWTGGYKIGAPALAGQYAAYIERQLAGFAQGIRHNDIYEQMRAIARQLTPDEMKAVAVFYGSQGPELAAKN